MATDSIIIIITIHLPGRDQDRTGRFGWLTQEGKEREQPAALHVHVPRPCLLAPPAVAAACCMAISINRAAVPCLTLNMPTRRRPAPTTLLPLRVRISQA